jgi:hypothetical protein
MSAPTNRLASNWNLLEALVEASPLAVARTLALLGLVIFPVHTVTEHGQCSCGHAGCRNAGKHPRTPNGLRDATRELDRISAWWRQWPNANLGVATGTPSGIWVLDIDPEHGGEESLATLETVHGELAPTWCVETGGGGFHLWFRLDGGRLRNSAGRLGPGLDVRANGGYVVVPPSRHRSGVPYRWAAGWHPTRVDLTPAPAWLLGLLTDRGPQEMIPPDSVPLDRKLGGNHSQPVCGVITEGVRNSALTSLAGAMRRKGAGERAIVAALLVENAERCQPQLAEDEVARIAHSVCRYLPANDARLVRSAHRTRGYVEFIGGKAVQR